MDILLLEPFFTGSHEKWATALKEKSVHNIELLTLPGRHWKWRMHGAAVTFAEKVNASGKRPDLFLATDMLDISTFKALLDPTFQGVPIAFYFHENQLTYPWSPTDEDTRLNRDRHYAFINYTSALTADRIFFNSVYHRESFLGALPAFLNAFPDFQNQSSIQSIMEKSQVLSLGLNLKPMLEVPRKHGSDIPVLLWNHRWEYDKGPEAFFELCDQLNQREFEFELIVCGEQTSKYPPSFDAARERFQSQILHWGFAETFSEYLSLLERATLLPVTSNQDFFGGSVVEAIAAGCIPLLPDRLAYPEHIAYELQSSYLYSDHHSLADLIVTTVRDQGDPPPPLRHHVSKYDWSNLIGQYDQALQTFID